MASKQNVQKIDEWNRENTDLIRIRARKDEHLPERIQLAVSAGKAPSRQSYIIDAVKRSLDADGIPIFNDEDIHSRRP